jgi:hemolysin D
VANVAADSTEATKGVWSFEVRITPQENKLMSGSDQFALCSSMAASVDIATDKRRLISYFFAPIVDAVFSALGER